MSKATGNQTLRHTPPYQKYSWDRVGIATIAPDVDLVELREFYDKAGFLPDGVHPSLVYHANSMNINDGMINLALISLKEDRFLELGTGHLYVRVPRGRAEPTVFDINGAIETLQQIKKYGTLEYTIIMPTGAGSEIEKKVDVKLEIGKLLAMQAQCLQIPIDLQSRLS